MPPPHYSSSAPPTPKPSLRLWQFSRNVLGRLGRRARFVVWLGLTVPCVIWLVEPLVRVVSDDEVTGSSAFKKMKADVLNDVVADFTQRLADFKRSLSAPPDLTKLPDLEKTTRQQVHITKEYSHFVNPFWSVSFVVEGTYAGTEPNLTDPEPGFARENLHLNSLVATFVITLLLIFLPLAIARTGPPISEIDPIPSDGTREILIKQVMASLDQVQFVRTMALFQLAAGVLVAFMGIVVYGLYSTETSSRDNHLVWLSQRQMMADRTLVASALGGDAARPYQSAAMYSPYILSSTASLFSAPSLSAYRVAFPDLLSTKPQPAAPAKVTKLTLDNLLALHKSLSTVDPKFFAEPNWWQLVNWSVVTRGLGILIFIEAVAWFLLQQYRRSMEDYKEFQRRAIKRGNVTAAHSMLSKSELTREERVVLAALLTEDLTGRIRQGESIDAIERAKIPDEASPVFSLFRDILSTVVGTGSAQSKPS